MGLKLFKKKKEEKEKEEEEEVEEPEEVEEVTEEENKQVNQTRDDDVITKIMERLNEVDNKLPRIDVSISNLKKEIDGLRQELQRLDDSLKDMMTLYEVVSSQINPFVGSSKTASINLEKINEIDRELSRIEELVDDLVHDFRILISKSVDVKKIIDSVLYNREEVVV